MRANVQLGQFLGDDCTCYHSYDPFICRQLLSSRYCKVTSHDAVVVLVDLCIALDEGLHADVGVVDGGDVAKEIGVQYRGSTTCGEYITHTCRHR